jgi:hypothetical protein
MENKKATFLKGWLFCFGDKNIDTGLIYFLYVFFLVIPI